MKKRSFTTTSLILRVLGKTFVAAKTQDMAGSISAFRYYAGWAGKTFGRTIEVSKAYFSDYRLTYCSDQSQTNPAKFAYTREEPIGVCVCFRVSQIFHRILN
jgi:acyl-CoA reductase-like NAD-dependent aldehyde dehydrogenase